jgi:DNA topoisomerase-1
VLSEFPLIPPRRTQDPTALPSSATEPASIVHPKDAARAAGLRYVSDSQPGMRRKNAGKRFTYVYPGGTRVEDQANLKRIRSIVIPPAWTDVWICLYPHGHVQATGRDTRGRKQYRYHPTFREVRESTKYEHMMVFTRALPGLRTTVREHMALRGLPRQKVLATVVHLLETTLIRIGNDDYARPNDSYGLATLKNRHVEVDGAQLRFRFTGKSGKRWSVAIKDRRVAKVIKACQELPGQELLQYLDEEGNPQDVTSADVNEYLREITGENITAKDFRTWAGTVLAGVALSEFQSFDSTANAKKNVRAAVERVASRLGNTATICRKCYIHPELLNSYLEGSLIAQMKAGAEREVRDNMHGLSAEEAAVLAILRQRLNGTVTRATAA